VEDMLTFAAKLLGQVNPPNMLQEVNYMREHAVGGGLHTDRSGHSQLLIVKMRLGITGTRRLAKYSIDPRYILFSLMYNTQLHW